MRQKKGLVIIILVTALVLGTFLVIRYAGFKGQEKQEPVIYYCPMHPSFTADKPGDCAICGMKLVKKESVKEAEDKERKILFYRNPMHPEVTSPVPMKDEMGMDYVPVYKEMETAEKGIQISAERQQFIGVKKEKTQKRILSQNIRTFGRVAYDPELYITQQEYLEVLKNQKEIEESASSLMKEQADSLLKAAERKLLLLGMSQAQIQELAEKGKPEESLYLPITGDRVWVYLTLYEYEIGMVKAGMPIQVESAAYPGEIFSGEIKAIAPILESMTRSIKARAEVKNQQHKLKPEMYVDVNIMIDLGERLAVREDAVMDTGERRIVFVAKTDGYFEARPVKLGYKATNYYEVLAGLKEGEEVVTSGNFLIDSESRLKSAISGPEHQHGQ